MILIIGGKSQGKRQFAKKLLGKKEVSFVDGAKASWEEFREGQFVCGLHQMIRRRLWEGVEPGALEERLPRELMDSCPDRVIITDEIGCGIVPMDRREREYRETVGRICCRLAAEASQVWRVIAGLGTQIRSEEIRREREMEQRSTETGVSTEQMESGVLQEIEGQTRQMIREFLEKSQIKEGQLLAVGCSSSEIGGRRIGSFSSEAIGAAVYRVLSWECEQRGIYLAAQCCEHLNRALILEEEAAERYGYEIVNVMPKLKAGGSFATAAYARMKHPVAVERIQAHGGIDIGDTLIGMHLKAVAVPVRVSVQSIGEAHVVCARVRPKFIGGIRAAYDEEKQ